MMTYSQNLKKCSICSFLVLVLLAFTLFVPKIHAAKLKSATKQKSVHYKLLVKIRRDLKSHQKQSFRTLLNSWQKKYGVKAVNPLMKLARYKRLPDRDRYIALMSATKIGGKAMAPRIVRFLKDKSWLMRSGSLRALRVLKDRKYGKATLPLLKDKSLIVRNEAVKTIGRLRPKGTVRALIRTLHDPKNYHKGKAQWVPQKALQILVKLKPKAKTAKYLRPLLFKEKDKVFLKQIVRAIEKISKMTFPEKMNLNEKIIFWKEKLALKRQISKSSTAS